MNISLKSAGVAAFAFAMLAIDASSLPPIGFGGGEAQALVGAPWTPRSFAGVARRTVVRRSTVYVNALPPACARVVINSATVWKCGGTYYQPYRGRYVVVYVR